MSLLLKNNKELSRVSIEYFFMYILIIYVLLTLLKTLVLSLVPNPKFFVPSDQILFYLMFLIDKQLKMLEKNSSKYEKYVFHKLVVSETRQHFRLRSSYLSKNSIANTIAHSNITVEKIITQDNC